MKNNKNFYADKIVALLLPKDTLGFAERRAMAAYF
jgi:hypothetical protein